MFLINFLPVHTYAQELNISIYPSNSGDQIEIYVDNEEWSPVSVIFEFDLKNMKSASGVKFTKVIPARSGKTLATTLSQLKATEVYGYKFKNTSIRGDVVMAKDTDFEYDLPYPKGKTYKIYQGYNGAQTHKGVNALDFSMKIGDDIAAVRSGIVAVVVDHNSKRCLKPECEQYNNHIMILHDDGTFSDYAHIRKGGSMVGIGDSVVAGQIIAESGDVGYAAGPHLHFSVLIPTAKGFKTIRTRFRTGDGTVEMLKEGVEYSRNY